LDVCDRAAGDCSEQARTAAIGIRRVLHGEASDFSIEYPCHSPTEQRWLHLRVTPVGEKGRAGAVVMHLNITERKQAEAAAHQSQTEARMMGRLSRMGSWTVEVPALKVTFSDEVCAIHEMPPGFAPTVEEAIQFYAPEFRPIITRAFEACARDGTPFDSELRLMTASGRRVWVRSIGEADRDAAGVIRRVQGAFQ